MIGIDQEIRTSQKLLDDVDSRMNTARDLMRMTSDRLTKVMETAGSRHMLYLVLFFVFFFIVVYVYISSG